MRRLASPSVTISFFSRIFRRRNGIAAAAENFNSRSSSRPPNKALRRNSSTSAVIDPWLPASVPGLCAQDLLTAGRIPDPYFGDQVGTARWIEERDFVYRTELSLTAEQASLPARLVFDSLDTFATLYLNGQRLAHQS